MKGIASSLFAVATLAFVFGVVGIFFLQNAGPTRITEYDRAGAINEKVIKRGCPEIVLNLRCNLGRDITATQQKALCALVSRGFVVSSLGLVIVLIAEKRELKPASSSNF